jgi:cytidylate kinase
MFLVGTGLQAPEIQEFWRLAVKETLTFKNSDAGKLVNRQIILSNARTKARNEGEINEPQYAYRIIAIEPDIGSLTKEIANTLAEVVKWQVFDDEIVEYIAKDAHVKEKIVREMDEKSQNLVQEEIEQFLRLLTKEDNFGEFEYHQALLKTLVSLECKGEAILVGHGCAFAFDDDLFCLRIRITSSLSKRIERLCKRLNEPVETVRKHILKGDQKAREFVQFHFGKNRDDLSSYDLVLNSDNLPVKKIVDTLLATMR